MREPGRLTYRRLFVHDLRRPVEPAGAWIEMLTSNVRRSGRESSEPTLGSHRHTSTGWLTKQGSIADRLDSEASR